jgi:hypothetical protein
MKGINKGERNGNWKGGIKPKNCLECGVEFIPKDHPERAKYCSIRCSKLKNKNPNWNNGGESYTGIHNWGRYNVPKPIMCQDCGKEPPRDLANISNEYKKEVSDWEWLCRKCHMNKDGRMNNLKLAQIRTIQDKICEHCQKEFRPWSNETRFCNRTCYDNMRRSKSKKNC